MTPLHSTRRRVHGRNRSSAAGVAGNPDRPFMEPSTVPENRSGDLPPYEWPAILDYSTEPAFVHDGERRILRCNSAYAARAALPMTQIIGKPYWQVFPKLPAEPPPCDIDHPLEGNDAPIVTANDGHVFIPHSTAARCPAGNFWYCSHSLEDVTARKKLEDDLAREQAILDAIIETAPDMFFLVDQEAKLVRWNSYVRQRSGLSDEQLRGYSALSLVHEDDRQLASAKLLTALATGSTQMEVHLAGPEPDTSYFLTNVRRVIIDDVPYVAGFCIDIGDRKRAEDAVKEQKLFLDALVENSPGVFCVLDAEGNFLRWNSNLNKLTGLSDRDLLMRSSLMVIHAEDRHEAARRLQEGFEKGYVKAILRVASKDRGTRSFMMAGRRFEVRGAPYMIGVGVDTTDLLESISALEHEARIDALTQIANRGHFMNRAVDEFARCRRYGHAFSLWIVDLDYFKGVNDSHGHQAGDTVLQGFVDMCKQALRDWDFIGRMGGEEFGVLLPETDCQQALLVAERLRQTVAATGIAVGTERSVSITVSIGLATMRDEDRDVHALLARADAALYEAKKTGRDKVCVASSKGATQ